MKNNQKPKVRGFGRIAVLAALLLLFGFGAFAGNALVASIQSDNFTLQHDESRFIAQATEGSEQEKTTETGNGNVEETEEVDVVITFVALDAPAAKAGVKEGDLLLKFNNKPVKDFFDFYRELKSLEAGEQITLEVQRQDGTHTLQATIEERAGQPYLGMGLSETHEWKVKFSSEGGGALIVDVAEESPAAKAGVQAGEQIIAIDGQEIGGENDLSTIIGTYEAGDHITLTIQDGNGAQTRDVSVVLEENAAGEAYLGVEHVKAPLFSVIEGSFFFFDGPQVKWDFDNPDFLMPEFKLDSFDLSERVTQSLIIEEMIEDGPAAKAGLQKGDQILTVNEEPVEKIADMVEIIETHAPDDTLTFTIQRPDESKTRQIDVTLGKNEQGEAFLGLVLGFKVKIEQTEDTLIDDWFPEFFSKWLDKLPFDQPELDWEFNAPEFPKPPFDLDDVELPEGDFLQGAIIHKVEANSPAEAIGLQQKDVITAIDGQTIDSLKTFHDLFSSHAPGDTIELTVKRRGESEPLKIKVKLDEKRAEPYLGVQVGFVLRIQHTQSTSSQEFNSDDFFKEVPKPPFDEHEFPAPPTFSPPHFRDFPTPPNFPKAPFSDFPAPPNFPKAPFSDFPKPPGFP